MLSEIFKDFCAPKGRKVISTWCPALPCSGVACGVFGGKAKGNASCDWLWQAVFDAQLTGPPADTDGRTTILTQPFLLPHEWVAALYRLDGAWAHLGSEELCGRYWQHFRATRGPAHPVFPTEGCLPELVIPIAIHGDDIAHRRGETNAKKVTLLTWHPIFDRRGTWDSRRLITVLPAAAGGTAFGEALHLVAWSLEHCWRSMHPETNQYGQPWPSESPQARLAGEPLCGPWKIALVNVRGDLAFQQLLFDWRSFTSDMPCPRCFATVSEDIPMTDRSPSWGCPRKP